MAFDLADPASPMLLEHHNKILEKLEKSHNVDVINWDFANAFDKADHGILLNKLKKIGINGKIGVWIHEFYQTVNNSLLSLEQHQVELKLQVMYPKEQC